MHIYPWQCVHLSLLKVKSKCEIYIFSEIWGYVYWLREALMIYPEISSCGSLTILRLMSNRNFNLWGGVDCSVETRKTEIFLSDLAVYHSSKTFLSIIFLEALLKKSYFYLNVAQLYVNIDYIKLHLCERLHLWVYISLNRLVK